MAVDADDKQFVGQPCCDQLLNNVWYDKLDTYQSTMFKRLSILLSFLTFGLLAPFLISFRKQPESTDKDRFHLHSTKNYGMMVNESHEEGVAAIPKVKVR